MPIFWQQISWTRTPDPGPPVFPGAASVWRRWPPLLLLFLAAACGLDAAPPARESGAALLRRAESAERRVAYVGIKVVRCYAPGTMTLMGEHEVRVWHRPPNLTRLEVLPPAKAAGLVAVDAGDKRIHYLPWRKRWVVLPGKPYKPPLELLLRNYVVRNAGTSKIAGRSARVLQIRSRYRGNRQKNKWVDRYTGITLKSELLDQAGRRISSWHFREIAFTPSIPSELFATPVPTPSRHRRPDSAVTASRDARPEFATMAPHYLPPGYTQVQRRVERFRGQERMMVRYTDGLNFILLVQERCEPGSERAAGSGRKLHSRPDGDRTDGARTRRAPRGSPEGDVISRVSWTKGELRFTLVGDVDHRQLERMASSMRPTVPPLTAKASK